MGSSRNVFWGWMQQEVAAPRFARFGFSGQSPITIEVESWDLTLRCCGPVPSSNQAFVSFCSFAVPITIVSLLRVPLLPDPSPPRSQRFLARNHHAITPRL